MKKQILSIGIALSKTEQKQINGGGSQCFQYYGCVQPECAEGQLCEVESAGPPILGTITNGLCCLN